MFSGTRTPLPRHLPLRWHRHLRPLSLLVTCIAVLAACGPAGAVSPSGASTTAQVPLQAPSNASPAPTAPVAVFPVTITDDAGRQVTVKAEPKRIVSVAPSNTEILFALGLDDRIVGVTKFCDFPEAAKSKPQIGGLRPSLEVIVGQEPDLVLAVRGTPADVIGSLEELGVAVALFNPPDFAGVLANIRTIGTLTGTPAAAEHLTSDMQRRWNAIAEKAKTATKKPRVLYQVDGSNPGSVWAAGPGTFIDAMITAAGGENVLATRTPGQQYPKLNPEVVVEVNPDLILLGDAAYGQSRESLAARPGWGALDAVHKGAVYGIPDPNLTARAGPRLVEGLEVVAKAIHPDIFGPPATG